MNGDRDIHRLGTEALRHRYVELTNLKRLQVLAFVFALCLYAFVTLYLTVPAFGLEMDEGKEQDREVKDFFSGAFQAAGLLEKGNYDQAIACHRRFLEKYPRSRYSALSYLRIAEIYLDLNDYGQAEEIYERILSLPGEDKLTRSSRKIAGRWKERIKLIFIKQALNRYYAREVEYPASLSDLLSEGYLKKDCLKDSPANYFYRSKNSNLFPDIKGQEYTLYSSDLGREEEPLPFLIKEKSALSHRFSLQGLVRGPEGERAVIKYRSGTSSGNEKAKIFSPGEKIGATRVLEITDEGVILSGEETLLILTMGR